MVVLLDNDDYQECPFTPTNVIDFKKDPMITKRIVMTNVHSYQIALIANASHATTS